MILEYLLEDVTLESLVKEVKDLEIDIPEESDYDASVWSEIKSKRFISTYEKIKGSEGQWHLSFDNGKLYLIQFNIEYSSRSENAYNKCMDICRTIFKINNSKRGMKDFLTVSERTEYQEFKDEMFSEKGIPDGYTHQFASYAWSSREKSAHLSASCIWPDSMSVEYREEPAKPFSGSENNSDM